MALQIFDPLIRGPLFGSLLIAVAASIFGVFAFVRREGLVGESIAHSTYPGIIIAAMLTGFFGWSEETFNVVLILGAFTCGWLGLGMITALRRLGLSADSALCFVLAGFFSFGVLGSSLCQHLFPFWQRQTVPYLFGQVAIMDDRHLIYGFALSALALLYSTLFFKEAMSDAFDPAFTKASQLKTSFSCHGYKIGMALVIVFAIKSVGVVLLSGLLVAPAIAARGCTSRLSIMLFLAPLFGVGGTFVGISASLFIEPLKVIAPGPLIVLSLSLLCLFVHMIAPREGLLARVVRRMRFRAKCLEENILKALWRVGSVGMCQESLRLLNLGSPSMVSWRLRALKRSGAISVASGFIVLTEKGQKRADHMVRLHRLWETYLAHELDVSAGRVHASAEQIEHVLTPELEKQLDMLVNVSVDPHSQVIPGKELA